MSVIFFLYERVIHFTFSLFTFEHHVQNYISNIDSNIYINIQTPHTQTQVHFHVDSDGMSTDFSVENDVTLIGGTLTAGETNIVNGVTIVDATFVPDSDKTQMSISVAANTILDQVGNQNTVPSNTLAWVFDGHRPNVTIGSSIADDATVNQENIAVTFVSSESVDFDISVVSVSGGTLSNFTGSNGMYRATFTSISDGEKTIRIAEDSFQDSAGNENLASNVLRFTYDSTIPTMVITAAEVTSGSTSNDDTLSLTFQASEPVMDFIEDDILVQAGT